MTTATTTTLTEQEKELLRIFRELDQKQRHHVILAAESVKATAEKRERLRW